MAPKAGTKPADAAPPESQEQPAESEAQVQAENLSQATIVPGSTDALAILSGNDRFNEEINRALKAAGLITDLELFGDAVTARTATVGFTGEPPDGEAVLTVTGTPDDRATVPGDRAAQPGDRAAIPADSDGQPRTTLDEQALRVTVDSLREAIRSGDRERVERILSPLLKADRDSVARLYQETSPAGAGEQNALIDDLRAKFGESDFQRINSILERSDGRTNDAGQVDFVLSRLRDGDVKADVELREIFATLPRSAIEQLKRDYLEEHGKPLEQAIAETPGVSDATKRSLDLLLKGSDERTATDNMELARIAVDTKDIWLLNQALRGTNPEALQARQDLQSDSNFMQGLRNAFQNDRAALDMVSQGFTSLSTIIDANARGVFGTPNKANVELALENATLEERKAYADGRDLAREIQDGKRDEASLTDSERASLSSYRTIFNSLEALSSGGTSAPDVFNEVKPDPQRYLTDTLGITPEQLSQYSSDEGVRRIVDARLGRLDEASRELSRSLLERSSRGEDISTLTPVEKVLFDRANGASPYRTLIDAEAALQDPALRERLKVFYQGASQSEYLRRGGTPETFQRDLALFNAINDGIRQANDNAVDPFRISAPLRSDNSYMGQLLQNGRLDSHALARLNFPRPFVERRLEGASAQEKEAVRDVFERFAPEERERNIELARMEDKLLYGGSLISNIARNGATKDDILTSIENMSGQDFTRLTNPQLSGRFRADIERAINLATDDPDVRRRAMELIDAKSESGDYGKSRDVRRSILDVADDKGSLVNAVVNMRPDEQARYRTDEQFRNQVNQRVLDGLDGAQELFAERMLQRLLTDGQIPKTSELTGLDKLLYSVSAGRDRFEVARNLEAVLAGDPALRERLKRDQLLNPGVFSSGLTRHEEVESKEDRVLAEIINGVSAQLMSEAPYLPGLSPGPTAGTRPYVDSLLRDGRLPPVDKIRLGFPQDAVFSELSRLSPQERDNYLQLMEVNNRLNPQERAVAENIFNQNGNATLADRLRLHVVGGRGTEYGDFKAELERLTPEERRALINEYATKYNSVLADDFLKNVDSKDQSEYARMFTLDQSDGRQEYYDALGKFHRSENGYGSDGTRLNSERALQLYAEALQNAQRSGLTLSPEQQAQLNRYFSEALDQYQDSKEELAKKLIGMGETALLFGAGVLAIAASGGTLAPEVVAIIAAAGTGLNAATRLAVMQEVLGNDFNERAGGVFQQLGLGIAEGALIFGPIGVPAIAESIAARSAARLAEIASGNTAITPAVSAELADSLKPVIQRAVSEGRQLTGAEIDDVVARTARSGGLTDAEQAALRATLQREAPGEVSDAVIRNVPEMINFRTLEDAGRTRVLGGFRDSIRTAGNNPAVQTQIDEQMALVRQARSLLEAGKRDEAADVMRGIYGIDREWLASAKPKELAGRLKGEEGRLNTIRTFAQNDGTDPMSADDVRKNYKTMEDWLRRATESNPNLAVRDALVDVRDDLINAFDRFRLSQDTRVVQTLERLTFPDVNASNVEDVLYDLWKGGNNSRELMETIAAHPEILRGVGGARFTDEQLAAAVLAARQRVERNLRQQAVVSDEVLPAGFGRQLESATTQGLVDRNAVMRAIDNLPQAQQKAAREFIEKGNGSPYGYRMMTTDDGRTVLMRFDPSPQGDVSKVYMLELSPAGEGAIAGPPGTTIRELHIQLERFEGGVRVREIKAQLAGMDKRQVYNVDSSVPIELQLDFANSGFSSIQDYVRWLQSSVTDIR